MKPDSKVGDHGSGIRQRVASSRLREKSTPKEEPAPRVMTIGHSTRTLEEFIGLLQAHGVTLASWTCARCRGPATTRNSTRLRCQDH